MWGLGAISGSAMYPFPTMRVWGHCCRKYLKFNVEISVFWQAEDSLLVPVV